MKFASANQKHYPDLGSKASSVWKFCARSQTSFRGETVGGVAKRRLFSQAKDSDNPQEFGQFRQMGYFMVPFVNKRHLFPPPPPLDSSLGCWLFPTVLSSNTSTKLHGGGRGGKATFFSFEVSKMPEALKRENCRN